MFKFVYPAALGLLAAAPAAAQDAGSFTGPRAEALVGLSQLRFDLSDISTRAGRAHPSDIGYGGAIGYDIALTPKLVGGVEVVAQCLYSTTKGRVNLLLSSEAPQNAR